MIKDNIPNAFKKLQDFSNYVYHKIATEENNTIDKVKNSINLHAISLVALYNIDSMYILENLKNKIENLYEKIDFQENISESQKKEKLRNIFQESLMNGLKKLSTSDLEMMNNNIKLWDKSNKFLQDNMANIKKNISDDIVLNKNLKSVPLIKNFDLNFTQEDVQAYSNMLEEDITKKLPKSIKENKDKDDILEDTIQSKDLIKTMETILGRKNDIVKELKKSEKIYKKNNT